MTVVDGDGHVPPDCQTNFGSVAGTPFTSLDGFTFISQAFYTTPIHFPMVAGEDWKLAPSVNSIHEGFAGGHLKGRFTIFELKED